VARGKVLARFAHLQLASSFLPIVESASGQPHGHAADLQVFDPTGKGLLTPDAVFSLPEDDREAIYLDRLIRTLHALNYLIHPVRGNLLLRVHPRHVLGVPSDHGLVFEETLRSCGLIPKQITLELEIDGIDAEAHLKLAVSHYKARGYHIAIHRFGRLRLNFALLEVLRPEIVRLDSRLLENPDTLSEIANRLQSLDAKTLIEGMDARALRQGARASSIDLLQTHTSPFHAYAGGKPAFNPSVITSIISPPVGSLLTHTS
jgi:EAL domain-containing protein (putative c-di-GMP-specific phosphodiesterase class I)